MTIPRIPFRRRLSVRQAQVAVCIAIAIGMVFAVLQIFMDARKERQNLAEHARFVLDFASLPAARATYRLDRIGAQELADSLLSDPAVVRATIRDDFNEQLASASKTNSASDSKIARLLLGADPVTFERDLVLQRPNIFVGKISLEIEPAAAAPGFEQRTINAVVSGLLKSTLLSALLLVIYHFMITKRITRLATRVSQEHQGIEETAKGDELDTLEARIEEWSHSLEKKAHEAHEASNAKSVFLASMSHEMRTPLNAIIGYAEMLELGIRGKAPKNDETYLNNITSAGRQLNKLLGDILDFSKIEAGAFDFDLTPMRPADTIRNNAKVLQDLAESEGLSFRVNIASEGAIMADKSRLRQIVFNLASNAIKYNKPGGSVEIGCEETSPGTMRVYVKDSGVGVPQDRVEKLFDDFVRGNHHRTNIPGAGLGLSISKLLTEGMNGRIDCTSVAGEGSTFWIEFDLLAADAREIATANDA